MFKGAIAETGALHQLGMKYFHELYSDLIATDEYRDVLRAIAEKFDGWVTIEKLRLFLRSLAVDRRAGLCSGCRAHETAIQAKLVKQIF